MLLVDVAQAVTTHMFGPCALYLMAAMPDAIFVIIIGTKKGETLPGPFSIIFRCSSISVLTPPMPEPMYTPNRSGATLSAVNPLSSYACVAAAIAYCVNRSVLRTSPRGR